MKKLYAFKNIQQLLKLDTTASKTRAKELSLENNFVTDLTSLVIPNSRDEDVRVANLGETSRTSNQDHSRRMSQNYASSGIQTTSLQFGCTTCSVSRSVSGYGYRSRSRSVYKSGQRSGSRRRDQARYNYNSSTTRRQTTTMRTTKTTTITETTTTTATTTTTTTSTTRTPENISSNCSITLYGGEYHGGEQILLTENVADLSVHKFEDKVYSVKVEGLCHWSIFTGKNNNQ